MVMSKTVGEEIMEGENYPYFTEWLHKNYDQGGSTDGKIVVNAADVARRIDREIEEAVIKAVAQIAATAVAAAPRDRVNISIGRLEGSDASKINAIRELRGLLHIGLKEAKDMIEAVDSNTGSMLFRDLEARCAAWGKFTTDMAELGYEVQVHYADGPQPKQSAPQVDYSMTKLVVRPPV
jgi:ribosomal protein L7/L12